MSDLKDVIYKLNRATLEHHDKHYVVYSDRLSSACRQLAFSEGAVFWIFNEASYLSIWIAIGLLALVLFFVLIYFNIILECGIMKILQLKREKRWSVKNVKMITKKLVKRVILIKDWNAVLSGK
ncbi:MAG: hypothetical protein JO149_01235 [Gammaproteobacteria bacterium]|nr:hypothetical protein [Gammaproteobacteria bacterium]